MRAFRTRLAATAVAVLAVSGAAALPAGADPPHFDVTGGNGLPTVGPFSNVTLNGTDQLAIASMTPFVVVDDSGTLDGWNVTLLVPDFHNGTGAGCTTGATATLSAASLEMNPPLVTPGDAGTSMTGVTTAGFTDFTSARKIIDAAAGHGDGTYGVAPQFLKLGVPAATRAGDYCTTATIAITSGP